MDIKKFKGSGSRFLAAVGIMTNVHGVAMPKDATPNLVKNYADYTKEVRLQDTRRQIRKTISNGGPKPQVVLERRASKNLRNPK